MRRLAVVLLLSVSMSAQSLPEQYQAIADTAKGRVGVAAMVIETGASFGLHQNERFPMQSVYKFPIAMAMLDHIDRGVFQLDQSIRVLPRDLVGSRQRSPLRDAHPQANVDITLREILRLNVAESDGSACDVLLRLLGGPRVVTRYVETLGIRGVRVLNTEREMGSDDQVQYRNWATPAEAVSLLRLLHQGRGLSASSRNLLLQWMMETGTGPHRLKAQLPTGTIVAHKTGTSNTNAGTTAATNDIGIVTLPNGQHLAIAVFVSDSRAPEATREAVIARIAKATVDAVSKR